MQEIMASIIVITITYGIYRLFELFARRKERMAIIEKLAEGIDPQSLIAKYDMSGNKNFLSVQYNGSWALRIGLLLIGVGFGVVLATIADITVTSGVVIEDFQQYDLRRTLDILYPSCAAVFGGVGLVVAYLVEKRKEKSNVSDFTN